jgi:hypothetical protein
MANQSRAKEMPQQERRVDRIARRYEERGMSPGAAKRRARATAAAVESGRRGRGAATRGKRGPSAGTTRSRRTTKKKTTRARRSTKGKSGESSRRQPERRTLRERVQELFE